MLDTRDPDRLVVVANTSYETKLLHWDPGCRYHGLEAYYLSLYLSASYIFLRLSVPPLFIRHNSTHFTLIWLYKYTKKARASDFILSRIHASWAL